MPELRAESYVIEYREDIEREWNDLQQRANHSYFQSWGWIGTWLDQIAIELQPIVIKIYLQDRLIGLGLFVSKDIKRRVIFHARAMLLNECPFDGRNMIIEYNGLLAERGHEEAVYAETIAHMYQEYRQFDEFYFGAIAEEPDFGILKKSADHKLKLLVNEQSVAWQVDLESFSPGLESYLASLSKNSRQQIRRSIKLYEEQAPLTLIEAKTVEEALSFFESLRIFHVKRWQSKGEPDSFANHTWVNFHKSLIQERFAHGEIQMIKVASGDSNIAFLFNYVWQQRVYVLQMGFNYAEDKRLKPGYVAHALVIAYNRSKGMKIYDFMHGDTRYKSSLGSGKVILYWVVLQRPRLKFAFEQMLVGVVRRLRNN